MADTFHKKEIQKRKQQKKKDKELRKAERKANAKAGQSLEDMMAYIDENGNLSSTPPDPNKKIVIKDSDIVIGSRNIEGVDHDPTRKGRVMFFNTSKGYGFIKDTKTEESVFVHANALTIAINENDMVSFETERTVKGLQAIRVKKI